MYNFYFLEVSKRVKFKSNEVSVRNHALEHLRQSKTHLSMHTDSDFTVSVNYRTFDINR